MARHAYKSEKRRKETARIKKQEEKRQRRFGLKTREEGQEPEEAQDGTALETSETVEEQKKTEQE